MEEAVLGAQGNKKVVFILNKIDLVPKEVVEKWLDYLQNELPTVAFKANTQHQEVHLDKFIWLLDAPGIVPGPHSEVGTILHNCVHVQKLADPVTPVGTTLQCCSLQEISNNYRVSGFQTTEHFLTAVHTVWGRREAYTVRNSTKIVKEITTVFDIEDTAQANEDTTECLAAGESDELLGDMDPLEMEINGPPPSAAEDHGDGSLATGPGSGIHPEDKKKMQKHADKITSKVSDSMMSAPDLSANGDDGVGD
ncbi:hypothetical protein P7K49_012515 [Saguinus oedipus]|uniref:Uncharacterized protein n=1 Tax=Saguinus oedipus TaxID=9490 RepID=A0ABQ9VTP2_SAGOE|nr:hypothetical protein P7K49_012515 [Saguinus oedipus]